MDIAAAVLVSGWAEADETDAAITGLLGSAAVAAPIELRPAVWRVADPLDRDEPVGRLRSVVRFWLADPTASHATVAIVPGSQGCAKPDGDGLRFATEVTLRPGRRLLLDGRCWYLSVGEGARAEFLVRAPVAAASGELGT